MKLTQRQLLYEQYKTMSDDKLNIIINDNSYEDLAKEVAKEILNSDRTEYHQKQEDIKRAEQRQEENKNAKISAQQTNPLYDDIHQIAKDISFIKNVIVIGIIISFIIIIINIVFFNTSLN